MIASESPRWEIVTAGDAAGDDFDLGLGGWRVVTPQPAAVSFDAVSVSWTPNTADTAASAQRASEDVPMIFRIDVPALGPPASAGFDAEAARLVALHARLDTLERRVDGALALASNQRTPESTVSFSVEGSFAPEKRLEAWVRRFRDPGNVSFASQADGAEPGRVLAFLEKIWRRVRHFAVIETQVGGRLSASTRVSWGGDLAAVVHPLVDAEELRLHERTVHAAMQQQRTLLRIILLTLRQAAKLALAAGSGNWLVALPAAWQFVKTVLEESTKL